MQRTAAFCPIFIQKFDTLALLKLTQHSFGKTIT